MSELAKLERQQLIASLTNNVSILFVPESDLVLALIRAHLYTEYLIEQVLVQNLPKGERITKGARFSYSQKLVVVSALNLVPNEIIASLRALNKIRNECAHELQHEIVLDHLTQLRTPLKNYSEDLESADHVFDLKLKLGSTIVFICSHLAEAIYFQN